MEKYGLNSLATVIKIHKGSAWRHDTPYVLIQYEVEGQLFEKRLRGKAPQKKQLGDTIKIKYDRKKPSKFSTEFEHITSPIGFIVIGMIFIALSFVI